MYLSGVFLFSFNEIHISLFLKNCLTLFFSWEIAHRGRPLSFPNQES